MGAFYLPLSSWSQLQFSTYSLKMFVRWVVSHMNCYLMNQIHKPGTKPLVLAFVTLQILFRKICICTTNLDLVCINTVTFQLCPFIPSHFKNFPFRPPKSPSWLDSSQTVSMIWQIAGLEATRPHVGGWRLWEVFGSNLACFSFIQDSLFYRDD